MYMYFNVIYILHIRHRSGLERTSGHWWSGNTTISIKIKEEEKPKQERNYNSKNKGDK